MKKVIRFLATELEEVVSPDPLIDVLAVLLRTRAILDFQIIGGIVYIQPNPKKRFDLEMMALEFAGVTDLGYEHYSQSKSKRSRKVYD